MTEYIPPDPLKLPVPITESPFFEEHLASLDLTDQEEALLRTYREKGYAVIDLDLPDMDEVAQRIITGLEPHYPEVHPRVAEAWYWNQDVRDLAVNATVLKTLRTLYQRDPIPFQTLNFYEGTHQPAHSDTVHFHCVPRHFMCGVWVALEDIHPDSGPLEIYPGSHNLPDYDMFDLGLESTPDFYRGYEEMVRRILAAQSYGPERLTLKQGQAAIWAANVFHGGSPVNDPSRTRQSQVTHYYFDDCLYYFPMSSDPFARSMCMREVIDLRDGSWVRHKYRGRELRLSDYHLVVTYPRPLPDWVAEPSDAPAQLGSESETELRARLHTLETTAQLQREQIHASQAEIARLQSEAPRAKGRFPFKLVSSLRGKR